MEGGWGSSRFHRQFHNWELKRLEVFFHRLQTITIRRDGIQDEQVLNQIFL